MGSNPDTASVIIFINDARKILSHLLSETGDITWHDRGIHYETKPKIIIKRFKPELRWFCKLTDTKTGIRARADDYQSKHGAREHATENLGYALVSAGVLRP